MRGERGSFYMGRFVEETNFLTNAIGSSSAYGDGVAFGQDAVMEGIAGLVGIGDLKWDEFRGTPWVN